MNHYDIFIDESCHLQHDHSSVMSIGFIKVPHNQYSDLKSELITLKEKHGIPHEFKWNTCSNTKKEFYHELIDFFFEKPLAFRTVVVKYKNNLNHEQFNQGSHDNFYYKLIYFLLNNEWFTPSWDRYRVFLDIKDTRGRDKLRKIHEVFSNRHYGDTPFELFQHIRSHESVFIQLADFFIGAVTYKSRDQHLVDNASPVKVDIIRYLEHKSGYQLDEGTEPWEEKFNIFDHQPRKKIL
ncbi:DUF3800 domain-containing protein [Carboxylicivirga taeanensis]|uniref:DUF3800 domain-containing protein n=1 Tax=Carboxylicivirga taeanensis TaxID=1416875 RepID=UPI003F6DDE36